MKKATNKAKTANKAKSTNKPKSSKSKPENKPPLANKPPVNKPKKTKTKKAKSPNIVLQKEKSPQNAMSSNNFEEAYRTMGVGMTRAQFKAQY